MKNFSVIIACTKDKGGIGLNGKLPWKLPKDMAHFKKITTETEDKNKINAVVMGRKTWESIPLKFRPLPQRLNVILSRTLTKENIAKNIKNTDDIIVASSLDIAFNTLSWEPHSKRLEKIYVIGGSAVYTEALKYPLCQEIIVTEIEKDFKCDVHWKADLEDYEEIETTDFVEDKESNWRNVIYKRKKKAIPWKSFLNTEEQQYSNLCKLCIEKGVIRGDRTGTGTLSIFGSTQRYSLRNNVFPLLTTKRTFWRGVAEELIWFVKGSTNAQELADKKVHIWDGNGSREFLDGRGLKHREVGDLGPVYGFQWRHFGAQYKTMHDDYKGEGVDQLMNCIDQIKNNPTSRRIIMTAWNPKAQPDMALPPCHMFCQFYVSNGELSCQMYQRSADMGLGVPFNIASYALLTRMIAQICNLQCGDFIHVMGDTHVYSNHVEPLKKQIKREPYPFPKLYINPNVNEIEKFSYEDFKIVGYKCHPKITMKMAI